MNTDGVWGALPQAPWDRLSRIHGSCHSSMVGLVAGWWVSLSPDHYVLDGAPGYRSRRNADAVLCDSSGPVGVVEVEGYSYLTKAGTIGHYLTPDDCHKALRGLHLGVLVMYAAKATRRQGETNLLSGEVASIDRCLESVREITGRLAGTEMLVVAIDKRYDGQVPPVRGISEYHHCTVSRITALRFVGGEEVARAPLLQTSVLSPGGG